MTTTPMSSPQDELVPGPPEMPELPESVEPAPVPHLSFSQQPWVQNLLPFATSFTVHALILFVGIIFFASKQSLQNLFDQNREQLIVPDAAIIENAPIGAVPNPGLGGDPDRAAAQDQLKDVSANADSWSSRTRESLTQGLMGSGSSESTDSVIGIGAKSGISTGTGGTGTGNTSGSGNDSGITGRFGVPGGGAGIGPKANFVGISGNAMKVAYVCDASGSMMNLMFALKGELRKAIDILKPIQAFNVIFFSDESKPQALGTQGLVMANADNKRKAYDFLNGVTVSGATNPIPGIELAFKNKPQLIYLLTDGNFPDNKAVLARVRDLNRDKSTKINTILFCDAANIEKEIVELLQQVAQENGGVFKIVDTKDF